MNTCSIGIELKLDCHKNTYCSQSEISEILNEHKYLLTLNHVVTLSQFIQRLFKEN